MSRLPIPGFCPHRPHRELARGVQEEKEDDRAP